MDKVSIIVPVYNAQKAIGRCIESILAQDYKEIEAILVDDGSRDSSWQIISEYAAKDERIVAIHKENSGVSSTRNLALARATGKYVQFVDADDYLPFDATKLMVRAIEEDDSDMVIADFYRVVEGEYSQKGTIKNAGVLTINEFADKMLLTPADFYYGVLWNKLYKKELLDKYEVRMNEEISMSEDAIFNLQYYMHVKTVSVIKAPVYYYVLTEGSLVTQNMNISAIVKQKSTVIGYYEEFYRQILTPEEYEIRRPVIYSYLVNVSTDSFIVPLLDKKEKVENDLGQKILNDEGIASELQYEYMSDVVFDRFLDTLARANKLELNEARILYYMYKKRNACTPEEISRFTGVNSAVVNLSLVKLAAASYIKLSSFRPLGEEGMAYTYINGKLDEQFDRVEEDFRSLCYDGLSLEEVAEYARMRKQIFANMKKTVIN